MPHRIPIAFAAGLFAFLLTCPPARAGESFPLPLVRDRCIDLTGVKVGEGPDDARDCAVSEFGRIGTVGAQEYFYALYCLIPAYSEAGTTCRGDGFAARYHRHRALAVFQRGPAEEELTLMLERATPEIGILVYEKPEIIENSAGTLLVVPIRVDGTGSGNESEYYLRQGGEWIPLDARSWLHDLRQRIPEQYGLWHGIWPDLRSMTATTGLYRPDDANCCPTGGKVQVRLAILDGRFVIQNMSINGLSDGQ